MVSPLRITNVVSTAQLGCTLDLPLLKKSIPNVLGRKERRRKKTLQDEKPKRPFSGILIRLIHPMDAHCQIYSNGKITINGGKSIQENQQLAEEFCKLIRENNHPKAALQNYSVVNLIACLDWEAPLSLEKVYKTCFLSDDYTPELFTGLTIRFQNCVAVLFHSGKVNFLGAKTVQDLQEAENALKRLLQ
jgi:TATA-box binding protein (TBP) (component of TFIID and TFIIIB)